MAWAGLPSEPLMSQTYRSMLSNNDLLYSHNASQNTLNSPTDLSRSSYWTSHSHRSDAVPSPSADILLSPVSPFSDAKHTYSPGTDCSPVGPSRDSTLYAMLSRTAKTCLSRGFVSPTPQSIVSRQMGNGAMQNAFGHPMVPNGATLMGNAVEQVDDVTMYGSERSYEQSQSSTPDMVPWYLPGYTGEKVATPQGSQHHQPDTAQNDSGSNSFLVSLDRNSRQQQGQWSNKTSVPAQINLQHRFMTPVTADEKAQRARDDETLLQMKQDGYTYKDIRKALGRKVAESTLRGRYRSLTKPRKDRVRAPKWSEADVSLSSFVVRLCC